MKLLKLKIRNINSIYGTWTIDFERPEYAENGIFLLTGPTGSGKSTILDAICLALFGRTPRVPIISGNRNDVLSRRRKDCGAELLFETGGKRYTVSWSQKVNRNNNLNQARHEISDENGNILENQIKGTRTYVEKLIGLSFDQFQRTVMLPQGEFDNFLSSNSKDKSDLFTKMTGSEIYNDISTEVRKRWEELNKRRQASDEALGEISVMTDQELAELKILIETLQSKKKQIGKTRETVNENLRWRRDIAALEEKEVRCAKNLTEHQQRLEAFASDAKRLAAADRAAYLEGAYANLISQEHALTETQNELKRVTEELPGKEEMLKRSQAALNEAEETVQNRESEYENEIPKIQKARKIDIELSELLKNLDTALSELEKREKSLDSLNRGVAEKEAALQQKSTELRRHEAYSSEHSVDGSLLGDYGSIEEAFRELGESEQEERSNEEQIVQAKKALSGARESADKAQKNFDRQKEELSEFQTRLDDFRKESETILAGKKLSELEQERDMLSEEVAAGKAIVDFEEQRKALEDGKPCPLCGSVHHPFVKGNIPSVGEPQRRLNAVKHRIDRVRGVNAKIEENRERENTEREKLSACQQEIATTDRDIATRKATLDTLKQQKNRIAERIRSKRTSVLQKTAPYWGGEMVETEKLLAILKKRKEDWLENERRRAALGSETEQARGDLKMVVAQQQAAETEREKAKAAVKSAEGKVTAKRKERSDFYGEKNPEEEEKRLNENRRLAREDREKARVVKTNAENDRDRCARKKEELVHKQKVNQKVLEEQAESFSEKLKGKGFETRDDFENARLAETEREKLRAEQAELEAESQRLKTEKDVNRKALEEKQAEKRTEKSADELLKDLSAVEEEMKKNEDRIIEEFGRATADKTSRKKRTELLQKREAANEEYRQWDKLWTVLGRKTGALSDFVHTLTFDRVINFANQRLKNMAPRYELLRRVDSESKLGGRKSKQNNTIPKDDVTTLNESTTEPKLDLDVIDHEQGGEVRVVENLSGGERFLVSLALALGISDLAARNVRIDSLFLDEGFGTLDENSLDNAISALEQLQQGGKMIGIVTHVEKLSGEESRIQTQIQVEPVGGGRSTLSGPGITRGREPEDTSNPSGRKK